MRDEQINMFSSLLQEIGNALYEIAKAIASKPIQVNIENNNDN